MGLKGPLYGRLTQTTSWECMAKKNSQYLQQLAELLKVEKGSETVKSLEMQMIILTVLLLSPCVTLISTLPHPSFPQLLLTPQLQSAAMETIVMRITRSFVMLITTTASTATATS